MLLPHNHYHISLFGYGITTKALAKRIGPCTIFDDKVTKPFTDAQGNRLRPSAEFDPRYSMLEIPSPGIPPDHPLVQSAQHLHSEYDYFADTMPYSIWISGTNGKTTTTQMMAHLLTDKRAITGGNIGTPLADLDADAPIWILETSSFTLHHTQKARPNLYALLPITPDHLNWHGSMDAYIQAKLSPIAMMQEGEYAILPSSLSSRVNTAATVMTYEDAEDLAEQLEIDISKIRFKGGFLLDAVMAMAPDAILYDRRSYDQINDFIVDPHRQEAINDTQGRLWVNDTKATNIDATLAALAAHPHQTIHLILGGDDKGVDLTPLFDNLGHYDVILYTLGSNEKRLLAQAQAYKIPHISCHTLDQAVESVSKHHNHHSVALLSPAAASFDQFHSYIERGERFKALVHKLS